MTGIFFVFFCNFAERHGTLTYQAYILIPSFQICSESNHCRVLNGQVFLPQLSSRFKAPQVFHFMHIFISLSQFATGIFQSCQPHSITRSIRTTKHYHKLIHILILFSLVKLDPEATDFPMNLCSNVKALASFTPLAQSSLIFLTSSRPHSHHLNVHLNVNENDTTARKLLAILHPITNIQVHIMLSGGKFIINYTYNCPLHCF